MSTPELILLTVGLPLALTLVIVVAVYASASSRAEAPRYRPGRPWTFPPEWMVSQQAVLAEPDQPLPALEAGPRLPDPTSVTVGGRAASAIAVPGPALTRARARRVTERAAAVPPVDDRPGGARGTW